MYGARTVLPSALMLRAHCLGRAGSLPRPVCCLCPGAQECTEEVQLSSYPDHWPKLGGYRSWGTGEEGVQRRNWAELLGRGVLVFLDCVLAPSPISLPLLLSSLRESGFLGAPVWLHELEELPSGADLFWVGFFS